MRFENEKDVNLQLNPDFEEEDIGVSPFYEKFGKLLKTHFSSLSNLEEAAAARSEREGAFLKKVNDVILSHISEEGFDACALGKALALSRSQLYRRLEPLIQRAPAHYIRYVRLHKAKDLLESGTHTIGEAAFRVGFRSQSHFTRVFREEFGFNPSLLRQSLGKEGEIISKPA